MEARSVDEIPTDNGWQYEPKWDGFRCLAFRDGADVFLQSKAGQPLARYFPDVVRALGALRAKQFVLDGELVIPIDGALSFDELQLRLHPAASRVQKLAAAHPALFIAFDLLAGTNGKSLIAFPLRERRAHSKSSPRNFSLTKSKSTFRRPRAICARRSNGSRKSAATSTASSPSALAALTPPASGRRW